MNLWGTWMAISWASNFGSGHDPTTREFKPHDGLSAVSTEPVSDPLSPSVSFPAPLTISRKKERKNKKDKESKKARKQERKKENKVKMNPWRSLSMRDTWVAQSVRHPTLGFRSGHDLKVCETEPYIRLWTDSMEPAWDSLSPSLSAPLSLSQNK